MLFMFILKRFTSNYYDELIFKNIEFKVNKILKQYEVYTLLAWKIK